MLKTYGDAVITRAHFADRLVAIGAVGDRNEAFDRYLGQGKPCFVPRAKVDPAEAIERIHQAGGIAILAHPVLYHLGNAQMKDKFKLAQDLLEMRMLIEPQIAEMAAVRASDEDIADIRRL